MTNEIEQYSGELVQSGPAEPNAAIGQLMQHAEAMTAAHRLGTALAESDLVPKDYKGKPGNAAIAILYGAELGLSPIQSVQQIFIVHGAPAIYARTMVALVKSKGYLIETVESSDEQVTVKGTDPRTGQVEISTWTYARAQKAGYTTNKKYDTDPQGMLYAKCSTEICRKLAPEVLLGIPFSREELELEQQPIRATAERVTGSTGTASLAEKLGVAASNPGAKPEPAQAAAPKARATSPKAETPPVDPKATKDQLERLNELLTNEKLETKEDKLAWLEGQFGRKFKSSAELLEVEAASVIEFLAAEQAADASKSAE